MSNQANNFSNNPASNSQEDSLDIYNAVNKRLCQAQVLSCVGSQCDTDTMSQELIDAYFWALWDIIGEARTLFAKLHDKLKS